MCVPFTLICLFGVGNLKQHVFSSSLSHHIRASCSAPHPQVILAAIKSKVDHMTASGMLLGAEDGVLLCDLSTVCSGYECLMDPSQLALSEASDTMLDAVKQISDPQMEGHPVLAAAALCVLETPLGNTQQLILQKESIIRELAPTIAEVHGNIEASCSNLTEDLSAAADALAKGLVAVPRVTHGLGGDFASPLKLAMEKSVSDVVTKALERGPNGLLLTSASGMKSVAAMLKRAVEALPWSTNVPLWIVSVTRAMSVSSRALVLSNMDGMFGGLEDAASVLAGLDDLTRHVEMSSFTDLPDTVAANLRKGYLVMCKCFPVLFPHDDIGRIAKICNDLQGILYENTEKVPEEGWPQAFVDASGLKSSLDALRAKQKDDRLDVEAVLKDTTAAGTFQVMLTRAQDHLRTYKHDIVVAGHFAPLVKEGRELEAEIGEHVRSQVKAEIDAAMLPMREMQDGMTGGGCWLDGLAPAKHKTWKLFFDYSKKTIVKDVGVASLGDKCKEIEKVLGNCKWNHIQILVYCNTNTGHTHEGTHL